MELLFCFQKSSLLQLSSIQADLLIECYIQDYYKDFDFEIDCCNWKKHYPLSDCFHTSQKYPGECCNSLRGPT